MKIITNENGQNIIHVLSTVNVVDVVDQTVHRESGVCTPQTIHIGAVSACISGVSDDTSVKDSIELLTNKQFKRERKRVFRQQSKQFKDSGSLGVKGAMVMMIALAAAVHAVSSISIATSARNETKISDNFVNMICSVASIATTAVVGTIMTNMTHIKHDNFEAASVLRYREQVNEVYKDYNELNVTPTVATPGPSTLKQTFGDIKDCNPLLPAPYSILKDLNVTVDEAKELMAELLARGWECMKDMPHKSKMKRRKDEEMHIQFADSVKDYIPPAKSYRTPVHLLPKLEKFLKELLELGIIRTSTSPFCSPVLMIPKPHQEGVCACNLKYRMCVSLKDVNALTLPIHHRIPNINSIWSTLGKAKYLSVLDLTHGFYQMNLCTEDGSAAKTAFGCEFGHFEFVGCCMGAKDTPALFQNNVERALKRHNLLNVGMNKIEAVMNWEKPVDITSLRSFLGMCNYLKPWYDGFARTTKPLTNLLKKGVGVGGWNETCDSAFLKMKQGFMRFPILRLPDFNLPMVVVADSCDISIGGAIMQLHETPDGSGKQLLPVSYYSRLLTKHELNYPIREKECVAHGSEFWGRR